MSWPPCFSRTVAVVPLICGSSCVCSSQVFFDEGLVETTRSKMTITGGSISLT